MKKPKIFRLAGTGAKRSLTIWHADKNGRLQMTTKVKPIAGVDPDVVFRARLEEEGFDTKKIFLLKPSA